MSTLWHGRFKEGPTEALLAFTVSLPYDRRLAFDDIAGSRAHARMLGHVGLLDSMEVAGILDALDQVEAELEAGSFRFEPTDEDIHTAVERRTTELAGAPGAKLHTGRSRNDQIATDMRLWLKREILIVASQIVEFQRVLLDKAREAGDAYMPGYTHMQRAQPVLVAHHLLAHGWALGRDIDRMLDCRRRTDVSPLGAGALAGSSLPLDPAWTARELGFDKVFDNSLDAVSDRDFVAEALFCLTMLAIHLSRLAEEIVLWSTDEFGFLKLDDKWSTGSSMMPQKKNPDIAELTRGKAGRLLGHLTGLIAVLKGLPLAYNRDLQEDKEPLFDALDQMKLALAAMAGLVATARLELDTMREAADSPFLAATDMAEWLVSRGTPFRDAHGIIGGLVREALARNVSLGELVAAHPALGDEAAQLVLPGQAVKRRITPGSTGYEPVKAQMARFELYVESSSNRLASQS